MQGFRRKCLYCPEEFDPKKGEGDHVLAARLFGEFEGDIRFRGVCTGCNNSFGRYEQLIAQSSPIGFYRRVVRPNLGRRSKRGSLVQKGVSGSKPPLFTAEFDGRTVLVHSDPNDPENLIPVDHLALQDVDGATHFIPLFAGMTAERLREQIARSGAKEMKEASFQCEPSQVDQVKSILAEVYPKAAITEEGQTVAGNYSLRARVKFQFSEQFFQGIAKIAFHYYLIHNRRGFSGYEDIFAQIRDFILTGGDPEQFFDNAEHRFAIPFGKTAREGEGVLCPAQWCHLITAIEDAGPIVVRVQLYVGPGAIPPPMHVTLGRLKSRIQLPVGAFGHHYIYETGRTGRFAGRVTPVEMLRCQ